MLKLLRNLAILRYVVRRFGRPNDRSRDEHLTRSGARTQSSRHVQGGSSVPLLDGDGLARVDTDPDRQRERGVGLALLRARGLELDGGPNRLRRGLEHGHGLVASQLDHPSAPRLHGVAGQIGEPLGEEGGRGAHLLPMIATPDARMAA